MKLNACLVPLTCCWTTPKKTILPIKPKTMHSYTNRWKPLEEQSLSLSIITLDLTLILWSKRSACFTRFKSFSTTKRELLSKKRLRVGTSKFQRTWLRSKRKTSTYFKTSWSWTWKKSSSMELSRYSCSYSHHLLRRRHWSLFSSQYSHTVKSYQTSRNRWLKESHWRQLIWPLPCLKLRELWLK